MPAAGALAAAYQRALAHVISLGDDGPRGETAAEARRALAASEPDARTMALGSPGR